METKKKHELSLAKRMAISLVCGLVAGLAFMFLREHLNASGQAQTWTTINNLLFQDITAEGAERAFGIFYIIGQLFIKALQLVIIPMVFTSISLAIGSIADTRTMGRISAKTLFWFLLCSFLALLLAGCVGYGTYSMGLFNTRIEGLAEASGSTGSNPLNVVLNIIPSNIITAFGSNGAVLSSVFLAVAIGLSMNTLGESRTATLRRLLGEVNDVVVVFLNFIVSNFAPFAVFVLLTRTFAIYGIDYLKPALVYVVVTVVLLLAFLIIAYPLVIALGAKLDPFTFIRKIANVAVFGFSTSSSAATLPLNIKVCEEEFGVDESIASFVLPLGMTINMDGTAIMQVIATVFIAGCAGYTVTPGVKIYEQTNSGAMSRITLGSLNGADIPASSIATYHLNSSNMVDYIVLKDVTGDAYIYGIMVSKTNITEEEVLVVDKNGNPVVDENGNWKYTTKKTDHKTWTLVSRQSTQFSTETDYSGKNGDFVGVSVGQNLSGGTMIRDVKELTEIRNVTPKDFFEKDGSYYVTISGKTYAVSENVECCKKVGGSRYTQDDWFQQDTGAERLNACRVSHQNMTIYIDPVGQQVRIVVGN